jgi:hypothetical protein
MIQLNDVLDNQRNQSLITYLRKNQYSKSLQFLTVEKEIEKEKCNIGTHPDIIELLWKRLTNSLPTKCQMIFFGRPTLINPVTGTVFGLAEGMNPPLLRLPVEDIKSVLENGGKIILSDMDSPYADAREVGNDWVYCFSFIEGLDKYILNAYKCSS